MYQYVKSYYDYIFNIVDKNLSINDGMNELINYCNKKCESDIWNELRELDFNEEKECLIDWIEENLQDSPPEDHIDCLYFGLFDGVYDDEETCGLYLSGAELEEGQDLEDLELEYKPDDMYANSEILYKTSKILKKSDNDIKQIGEYVIYLGYAVLIIKEISKSTYGLFNEINIKKIVIGFDEGDCISLDL